MKKTKLLTTLGAVALIGAIGVGSTFAYLTADTDAVKNTFAVGDIEISLDETDITNKTGPRVKENHYTELLPTQIVTKDPQVHVAANSEESYVFMTVEGVEYKDGKFVTDEITSDNVNAKWKYLGKKGEVLVFAYEETVSTKAAAAKDLEKLFTTITVNSSVENDATIDDIVIDAYAIQSYGFSDAKAAATELKLLAPQKN